MFMIHRSENLVEYRQEEIPKSTYHTFLDEGGEDHEISEENPTSIKSNASEKPMPPSFDAVRYWSDFSRVYYHPRSLQKVGATLIPEANDSVVSWNEGQQAFQAYDKV